MHECRVGLCILFVGVFVVVSFIVVDIVVVVIRPTSSSASDRRTSVRRLCRAHLVARSRQLFDPRLGASASAAVQGATGRVVSKPPVAMYVGMSMLHIIISPFVQ